MLFIILGIIIGVAVGIYMAWDIGDGFWGGLFIAVLMGLLGGCLGCFIMIAASSMADCSAEKTYYIVEDTDIYALQDNLATEGSFFLGSGHINDELTYFYVKETDVGYTVCNVDADKSYIKFTSDRCHLVKRSYTFDNWFVRLIAVPWSDQYIFYIPDGSIINNYTVDLK